MWKLFHGCYTAEFHKRGTQRGVQIFKIYWIFKIFYLAITNKSEIIVVSSLDPYVTAKFSITYLFRFSIDAFLLFFGKRAENLTWFCSLQTNSPSIDVLLVMSLQKSSFAVNIISVSSEFPMPSRGTHLLWWTSDCIMSIIMLISYHTASWNLPYETASIQRVQNCQYKKLLPHSELKYDMPIYETATTQRVQICQYETVTIQRVQICQYEIACFVVVML